MSGSIGPSLPPGFAARQSREEEEEEEGEGEEDEETSMMGPSLPPISKNADSAKAKVIGPCMAPPAPHSRTTPTGATHMYGPSLPPGLVSKEEEEEEEEEEEPESTTRSDDDDEEMIGPMPSASGSKVT